MISRRKRPLSQESYVRLNQTFGLVGIHLFHFDRSILATLTSSTRIVEDIGEIFLLHFCLYSGFSRNRFASYHRSLLLFIRFWFANLF